jgi:hypothetical protein
MACTGYGRSIANLVLLDQQGKRHFLATARCMYQLGSRNATEASPEDVPCPYCVLSLICLNHLLRDVPLQILLFSFGAIVGPAQLYVDRAVQRKKLG